MASAMLNVYDTWLTRPNQDRTSVRFLGVGKLDIEGNLKASKFNVVLSGCLEETCVRS